MPPTLLPAGAMPVTMVTTHPTMSPANVPTMLLPVQPLDTGGGRKVEKVVGRILYVDPLQTIQCMSVAVCSWLL